VVYNVPRVVPATYSVHDYGRYVSNFRASDETGSPLEVKKLDTNRWEIAGARKLSAISYEVDDTWDSPQITGKNVIFEPAGTNFDKGVFVLNPFALFGYFDGLQDRRFEVEITKPGGLYGATSLTDTDASEVVDGTRRTAIRSWPTPIVLSPARERDSDDRRHRVPDLVYSPEQKVPAKNFAKTLEPLLKAQKAYLGDAVSDKEVRVLVTSPTIRGWRMSGRWSTATPPCTTSGVRTGIVSERGPGGRGGARVFPRLDPAQSP
jgi:predicted metalloprotease with PDZ domain